MAHEAGHGPQVMATLRNASITLMRLSGWTSIAAGLRHHSPNDPRPTDLFTALNRLRRGPSS